MHDLTPPSGQDSGSHRWKSPAGDICGKGLLQGPLLKGEISSQSCGGSKHHGCLLVGYGLPSCKGCFPTGLAFGLLLDLLLPNIPLGSMVIKAWAYDWINADSWDGLEDGRGHLGQLSIQGQGDGKVCGQGGITHGFDAENCSFEQRVNQEKINIGS